MPLSLLLFRPIALAQPVRDDPAATLDRLPQLKNEIEKDRVLRQGFEAALDQNIDIAQRYLPLVIDKPWLAEMDFRRTCALARATADAAAAKALVLAVGLHNPELALRESGQYLPLAAGPELFERFVLAAPDQAMGLATGSSKTATAVRQLMAGAHSPEMTVLSRLAEDTAIDLPRRGRMAILAARIAHGGLSLESAMKIAASTPQFFATVLDMRTAAPAPPMPPPWSARSKTNR